MSFRSKSLLKNTIRSMDLDISIFSTLKLKTIFYKQIIQIISLLLLPPSSSARTSTSFPSTSTTAAASSVFSSATFTSVASLSVSGNLLFSNKNLKCSSRFFAIQNSSEYFVNFSKEVEQCRDTFFK